MSQSGQAPSVLVTGASGFVGACLTRRLLRLGHPVHLLLRAEARSWRIDDVLDQATVHRVDLRDADAVQAALAVARPDVVQHLAAFGAYESQADPRTILETNILGTCNLLEASQSAGVKLFVNAGSSSEYGYKPTPMAESDRLEPNSTYAVAKAAQTHLCTLAAQRSALATVTFRLFSVYGPWEEPTRLMPTLLRRARAGLPLEMVSPRTARDFVHVDDVLDALLDFDRLLPLRGEVFNLGTGVQTTLAEVVAIVQRLLGDRSPVRWGAMTARKWDTDRWSADPTRARERLGWAPQFSLAQGLADMADWMERQGDDYGPEQARTTRTAARHGQHPAPLDHRTVA